MMNKSNVTSQILIDDASAYYVNLKNTGAWKVELSKNLQLIVLTTRISELESKISKHSGGGQIGGRGGSLAEGRFQPKQQRIWKCGSSVVVVAVTTVC